MKENNPKTEKRLARKIGHSLILGGLVASLALLPGYVEAGDPEKAGNTGAAKLSAPAGSGIVMSMRKAWESNSLSIQELRGHVNGEVIDGKDPDMGITKPPIELLPRAGHRVYGTQDSFLFVEVSEYKYYDNGYWKPGVTGFNMPVQFSAGVGIRF